MTLHHSLIADDELSEAARRALAPGPARMMAARGLAPLSEPTDLVTVLYQLAQDPAAEVAQAARRSTAELPDAVLRGALSSPHVDPRVLDYLAGRLGQRAELIELIVLNPATADATIAALAATGDAARVDLIAQNEQRLLRHPGIIAAMYGNRAARMSTVDRAVELAIRNGVKVAEISAWDELAAAVLNSGKKGNAPPDPAQVDAVFESAARLSEQRGGDIVLVDEEAEAEAEQSKELPISQMTVPMKIRLATLGNAFARGQLIRDPIRMVALAAIKSPGVKDAEAIKYAGNNSLHEDVIAFIANKREWTKLYTVKSALVRNPKTPLPMSMRLISHLREKDLRLLAKSKNIPTALSAQARKLVMNRGGKKG